MAGDEAGHGRRAGVVEINQTLTHGIGEQEAVAELTQHQGTNWGHLD